MSIRRAMNRLVSDEFEIKVQGSGVVTQQIPAAGGRVRSGFKYHVALLAAKRDAGNAVLSLAIFMAGVILLHYWHKANILSSMKG